MGYMRSNRECPECGDSHGRGYEKPVKCDVCCTAERYEKRITSLHRDLHDARERLHALEDQQSDDYPNGYEDGYADGIQAGHAQAERGEELDTCWTGHEHWQDLAGKMPARRLRPLLEKTEKKLRELQASQPAEPSLKDLPMTKIAKKSYRSVTVKRTIKTPDTWWAVVHTADDSVVAMFDSSDKASDWLYGEAADRPSYVDKPADYETVEMTL